MKKQWLFMGLAAALAMCGCGGGGGGTTTASGGGSNNSGLPGGGNNNNPNPLGVSLNFQVANFGGAQQATLLKRNTPATEQGATAVANSSSANKALDDEPSGRDLPPELLRQELEKIQQLPPGPAEPSIRPKFQEIPEGGTFSFFVVTSGLTLTCQKMHDDSETQRCSIFAEQVGGTPVINKARALQIAAAFDTDNPFTPGPGGIYDQVRAVFGSEWTAAGGRDGDAKITLVFLSPTGIGGSQFFGFFRPTDEFAKAQFSTSNEGEILYLNADKAVGDNFDVLGTIAHEFQHLVSFNVKQGRQGAFNGAPENSAIDEGKSVLAEDLTGYGLVSTGAGSNFVFRVCQGFLLNPSRVGLFVFDGANDCYGRNYTFMRYLFDRFGQSAYQTYAQSPGTGLAQLNASFGSAASLLGDWQMALLASPLAGPVPPTFQFGPNFNPRGTYNIRSLGSVTLPGLTPAQVVAPPTGVQNSTLPAWAISTVVYRNGTGNTLNINLQGDSGLGGGVLIENPQGTFFGVR